MLDANNKSHIEFAARMAHNINRAYCLSIGDKSQNLWELAPEWQVKSAIEGVKFHIENPGAGADASHENWKKTKVLDGWIYGGEKNEHSKTHPCIVPFNELPVEQQAKDYLFREVVHSLFSL